MNYYNEIDLYCAEWLNNLIAAKLIPPGFVDTRSIVDVQPEDLNEFTQCHFFAGIAGWSRALELAGWPADRPVWTGSCPCQPFSVAGKRKGTADARHLFPELRRLTAEQQPPVLFGEQVAAATDWLAGVRGDLEALGYTFGAIPIEAACAGAPQYRDRIWFVASGNSEQLRDERHGSTVSASGSVQAFSQERQWVRDDAREQCEIGALSGDDFQRESDGGLQRGRELCGTGCEPEDTAFQLAGQHSARLEGRQSEPSDVRQERATAERSSVGGMVRDPSNGWGEGWTESEFRSRGFTAAVASLPDGAQFIECPDGKWRRLPPPRVRWLGNGIPARVAKLRAFGNGIYPPAAAEFIGTYMEITQ